MVKIMARLSKLTSSKNRNNIEEEETNIVSDRESNEDEIDQDTESEEDEDDSDDNGNDDDKSLEEENENGLKVKEKQETVSSTELEIEKIHQKYKDIRGKQLYIRFSSRLPENEEEFQQKAKSLSPLIVKVHKPRQKYARFCLVDFRTKEDRDTALKNIQKSRKTNEAFKGIIAELPRTENEEFVKKLADQKLKSLENKKAKKRVKRESKRAERGKNHTASIVVINLPKTASILELRKVIPNAVDIHIRPGSGLNGASVAAITLPSTLDATSAVRRQLTIGGTKLIARFDKQTVKSKYRSKESTNPRKTKQTEKELSTDFVPIKKHKMTPPDGTFKAKRKKSNKNI